MNLSEYQTAQRRNSSGIVRRALAVFKAIVLGGLSDQQWEQMLDLLYPLVREHRLESSRIAREFYDSEREAHDQEPWPVLLSDYKRDWFSDDMDKYKPKITKRNTSQADVTRAALGVVRVVENGGRRTVIDAIEDESAYLEGTEGDPYDDEDPGEVTFVDSEFSKSRRRKTRGWARVATGAETCSWCMMLVSRGPVYKHAGSAGAKDAMSFQVLDDFDNGVDIAMEQWHPGCDCKVVPVFDDKEWPGRETYSSQYELWKEITKDYYGKDKLNAWRRYLERGTT